MHKVKLGSLRFHEQLMVAVLVLFSLAVCFFTHYSLTRVQESLPEQVLRQQTGMNHVSQGLFQLVVGLERVRSSAPGQRYLQAMPLVEDVEERLSELRRDYSFDSLTGAAQLHAVVNPGIQDVRRWLTEGAAGYQPGSDVVIALVAQRAAEVHEQSRALTGAADAGALTLLEAEAARIGRLRNYLVLFLIAFLLLTIIVIFLLLRQRDTAQRADLDRERFMNAVEHIEQGIAHFDAQDRLVLCNQPFRDLYLQGTNDPQRYVGTPYFEIVRELTAGGAIVGVNGYGADVESHYQRLHRSRNSPFELELVDGRFIRVNEHVTSSGEWVFVHTDITDLRKTQRHLQHLATHDALTGLPTRRFFEEQFQLALVRGHRHNDRLGLMFIDLDNFKAINDRYGHAAGDEVLVAVAERLKTSTRDQDMPARLGGDEFVVFLTSLPSTEPVRLAAERVLGDLARPIDIYGEPVTVTVSIGIAIFPGDGLDMASLLRCADIACYRAKAAGRNGIVFYTDVEVPDNVASIVKPVNSEQPS
ncbi:MAG: diguanylate cyclase [Pseudomonadota bacterium]